MIDTNLVEKPRWEHDHSAGLRPHLSVAPAVRPDNMRRCGAFITGNGPRDP